jgi:hypothetical protein
MTIINDISNQPTKQSTEQCHSMTRKLAKKLQMRCHSIGGEDALDGLVDNVCTQETRRNGV